MTISAWAILRDVDITVPKAPVELSGGSFRGHITNEVPATGENPPLVLRVRGHTLMGDVTAG